MKTVIKKNWIIDTESVKKKNILKIEKNKK